MIKKQRIIAMFICLLNIAAAYAQTSSKVTASDFQPLTGDWKGTLTYLDYSLNKPYTMPANIRIRRLDKSNLFIFSNLYPDEPNANSSDTLSISKDGNMLNKETVKSNMKLNNGIREIITEILSMDGNNNKPAIIRTKYSFGQITFTKSKEVQFVGEEKWIKRHEYSYTRK